MRVSFTLRKAVCSTVRAYHRRAPPTLALSRNKIYVTETALFGCPCCALRPLERPLACPFSAVRAPCIPPPRANRSALRPSHRTPQASTPPPSPMSCTCALASAAPFGHRWPRGRRSFQRTARESRGPPSAISPHIPCAKEVVRLIGVARNLAHSLAMPVGDNFMTDQE